MIDQGLVFVKSLHINRLKLNFIVTNSKTRKHDLKPRHRRRLAADRYKRKTSGQFLKKKYRQSFQVIKKLFFEKSRKTNDLHHELHHYITYPL